jgi:hypothetical protein
MYGKGDKICDPTNHATVPQEKRNFFSHYCWRRSSTSMMELHAQLFTSRAKLSFKQLD